MTTLVLLFTLTDSFAQETEKCVYLKRSVKENNRSINVVMVPSAFGTDMANFETSMRGLWSKISTYEPFSDLVDSMNVIVAKAPHSSNSHCRYRGRLLYCDSGKARAQASECMPDTNRYIITIHNNPRYGGKGNTDSTTAYLGEHSASIIVHELGHAIFRLSDEYLTKDGSLMGRNCTADRNCGRWSDLIDAGMASCRPGCRNNSKYTSELSVMDLLSAPSFGHVNTRLTCCTFKSKTGAYPPLCNQYLNVGSGLDSFCRRQRWGL